MYISSFSKKFALLLHKSLLLLHWQQQRQALQVSLTFSRGYHHSYLDKMTLKFNKEVKSVIIYRLFHLKY